MPANLYPTKFGPQFDWVFLPWKVIHPSMCIWYDTCQPHNEINRKWSFQTIGWSTNLHAKKVPYESCHANCYIELMVAIGCFIMEWFASLLTSAHKCPITFNCWCPQQQLVLCFIVHIMLQYKRMNTYSVVWEVWYTHQGGGMLGETCKAILQEFKLIHCFRMWIVTLCQDLLHRRHILTKVLWVC